ncbi:MAG: B12-binding domain-containing radical SAM protein, partial [bacterium]
ATRVQAAIQRYPLLSYSMLSAVAREKGFSPVILDMGVEENPYEKLDEMLKKHKPRFVGITSTSPLFFEVADISKRVKKTLGGNVTLIYGGPHATALPEESLNNSDFDLLVYGEGERTLIEIMEGRPWAEINGIYYRQDGKIVSTPPRELIEDLDSLPFPALDLYDLEKYRCAKLISRRWPLSQIETSRGCPHKCSFCNKNISYTKFRKKSPERVIAEMKYMISQGVRELRVIDDQFATNLDRAKEICRLMLKEKLDVVWNMAAGVRADRVDQEFLDIAKRAGCYQVGIGFESGDPEALASINKKLSIEDSIKGMNMIRKSGIESVGFFMLGLPGDTEETMDKTIDFALKLMPDLAKATITMPFPGTDLFDEYDRQGLIKTRNWELYGLHGAGYVYEHPTLSRETLVKYYDKFFRKFYLNPRFLRRRAVNALKNGTLLTDIKYGLQTFFPSIFPAKAQTSATGKNA